MFLHEGARLKRHSRGWRNWRETWAVKSRSWSSERGAWRCGSASSSSSPTARWVIPSSLWSTFTSETNRGVDPQRPVASPGSLSCAEGHQGEKWQAGRWKWGGAWQKKQRGACCGTLWSVETHVGAAFTCVALPNKIGLTLEDHHHHCKRYFLFPVCCFFFLSNTTL